MTHRVMCQQLSQAKMWQWRLGLLTPSQLWVQLQKEKSAQAVIYLPLGKTKKINSQNVKRNELKPNAKQRKFRMPNKREVENTYNKGL